MYDSFLGVILVSSSDYGSILSSPLPSSKFVVRDHGPLLGDFLALLSAMFYAFYIVLLKVRVGTETRIDMKMFFGFVGLISICCSWIVGVLLHLVRMERLGIPGSRRQWGGVLLNVVFKLSSIDLG